MSYLKKLKARTQLFILLVKVTVSTMCLQPRQLQKRAIRPYFSCYTLTSLHINFRLIVFNRSSSLRLIHESGLQPREVSLLYTKKPQCTSRGSSFVSVGIIDCYAAAAVFAGGILAAIFVFVLEIYANYRFDEGLYNMEK